MMTLLTSFPLMSGAVSILTLGLQWDPSGGAGYGTVKPHEVSNGGDPTGVVSGIIWHSWGGAKAIGIGKSDYVPPGQTVAGGRLENVRIVAFQPGLCAGRSVYRAVEWYFPEHSQAFHPGTYINACTGAYVNITAPPICNKSQMTSSFVANGIINFQTLWLACQGDWALAGGYSTTIGFSVALLNKVNGSWAFIDNPSDGFCMLARNTLGGCNFGASPTLPIPYRQFRVLVISAGLRVVGSGNSVTMPAGWTPH